MKTTLKVMVMFAFVAIANSLFAIGNLKLNIEPLSDEKAVVAISSLTESNLKISLEDNKGRIVFFNEVSEPSGNYRKTYNFSELEDGAYTLLVESDNLTTKRTLDIKYGRILVGEERTTIQPFFNCDGDVLRLSYLNFPKENLTFYFFDKGNVVYSKKFGRDFTVNHAINLSKLQPGNYVAVLSTREKDYTYSVDIN